MLFNLPRHYCHPILQGEKPRHQKVTRDLTNLIQLAGGRNQGSNPSTPSPQSSALTLRASHLNFHSADFCSWETPLGRVAGPPEGPINHSALAEPGTLFTWRSLLPPLNLSSFLAWRDPGAAATVFQKREASWLQHVLNAHAREKRGAPRGTSCHCVYI